jgi:succinyl-diaminopimelate desuccinylase
MIKIGRRGSMTAHFEVVGKQGHSAYLHKALNPMPAIAELAHRLSTHVLDEGTEHFDPSTISVTTIDTGNPASNVIPARSRMTVNIRFNDLHTGAGLGDWLRAWPDVAQASGTTISTDRAHLGRGVPHAAGRPERSRRLRGRGGHGPRAGPVDHRRHLRRAFRENHCPVVEFGLVGHRMHEVDERVWVQDIHDLKAVYARIIADFFAS